MRCIAQGAATNLPQICSLPGEAHFRPRNISHPIGYPWRFLVNGLATSYSLVILRDIKPRSNREVGNVVTYNIQESKELTSPIPYSRPPWLMLSNPPIPKRSIHRPGDAVIKPPVFPAPLHAAMSDCS